MPDEQKVSDEVRIEQFTKTLETHGLDLAKWNGENGTKTPRDLFEEIEKGESGIDFDKETGEISRVTYLLAGDTYYIDQERGVLRRLIEEKQVYKSDGTIKRRKMWGAVAEKTHSGENNADNAVRALQEELNIKSTEGVEYGTSRDQVDTRTTPTYPGLNTRYEIRVTPILLPAECYDPEGYSEYQPTKIGYHKWFDYGKPEDWPDIRDGTVIPSMLDPEKDL